MSNYKKDKLSRLVYSTEKSIIPESSPDSPPANTTHHTIYLQREVKGRGGKTVTTISDLMLSIAELEKLAGDLKRTCGSGGSVKDGVILIQGDHRTTLKTLLEKRGYKVKLAGG